MNPTDRDIAERCLPAIEAELNAFLDRVAARGLRHTAEMARYQFSSGGKRLRALIPCQVFAALGRDPLEALPLSCSLEMVHNATLVHDDLQDGDVLRRGQPTLWKRYSAAQAINCGDAMFHLAFELLNDLKIESSSRGRLSQLLNADVLRVIEGQAQEFALKDEAFPSVEKYIEVVGNKTAALVAASFALAVEAAGKPRALSEAVRSAGLDLGILFQMQDDVLDVYGDKGRDRRATDIAEGKISVLIAQLLEDARPADRERSLSIVRKPREQTSPSEIDEVISLFERYGTLTAVLDRISRLQSRIALSPVRAEEPMLHRLLCSTAELFLKPIAPLMPAERTLG